MGMNRLEVLLSMVDQNPADGFSRYGLAMEYVKSGDLMTALEHFMHLLEHNPNASLFDILEDIERRIIIEKLERCNWNQTDAAEQFHIPLSTLNQKIKRLNIEIRKRGRE